MAGISMDNQHRTSRIFRLAKPTMQMGSVLRQKVNILVTQVFRFPISNRIFGWKKQRFVDTRRSARSIHLREGQEKCSKQERRKYWYRDEFPFHGYRSITFSGWFGGITNCNLSDSVGDGQIVRRAESSSRGALLQIQSGEELLERQTTNWPREFQLVRDQSEPNSTSNLKSIPPRSQTLICYVPPCGSSENIKAP